MSVLASTTRTYKPPRALVWQVLSSPEEPAREVFSLVRKTTKGSRYFGTQAMGKQFLLSRCACVLQAFAEQTAFTALHLTSIRDATECGGDPRAVRAVRIYYIATESLAA